MINIEIIGKRIAYFRQQNSLTQGIFLNKVSELTGRKIRQATLSNWERGITSPPMELAPVFAHIFDIGLDELFGLDVSILEEGSAQSYNAESFAQEFSKKYEENPDTTFYELLQAYGEAQRVLSDTQRKCARLKSNTDILKKVIDEYLNRLE